MTTMQGVDCSFYNLLVQQAQDLKSAGVEAFMQCILAQPASGPVQPPPRVTNLRNALNVGLYILAYAVLPAGGDYNVGVSTAQFARQGIPQDIWDALLITEVDVELPMQPLAINGMADSFTGLGKRAAIYTNYNTWVNVLGNPKDFTGYLLHNALWDNAPDINFASLPFGGWSTRQVLAEQWSGGVNIQGVFADRDTFVKELLLPEIPDSCALSKLRAQFLEEIDIAAAKGDYKTLVRWGQYLGG